MSAPCKAMMSLTVAAAVALAPGKSPGAESFRRGGTEFNAARPVSVPGGKSHSVVVTEFYHHGEIAADGRNVVVVGRNQQRVPTRILQLGPGDFCRLAFQTVAGSDEYEIYYGGNPPGEAGPAWTSGDGLLLETRRFKQCNLNSLDAVRKAFDSAIPIGADYVEYVQHSRDPFSTTSEPFFSRYSGQLNIERTGKYGFMTSSQDCSFLLIDDKLVVAVPGHHGPAHQATRGSRQDVQLSGGPHKFEYYHAAAGDRAMMVAAWEINPTDPKPQKPEAIPPELFHNQAIARAEAGPVTTRTARLVPDFGVKIVGDVPLPDNNLALVEVSFHDRSPKAVTMGAKATWDFGDGQTSEKPNPEHVYLRPGLYKVTLAVKRGAGKPLEMTNRVSVERPVQGPKDKAYTLDEFLPILETYDPRTLDAIALRQLVLAFEAKAASLEGPAEAPKAEESGRRAGPREPGRGRRPAESRAPGAAERYIAAAVDVGKVAFIGESAAKGDEDLLKLAQLVGPMARDRLGNLQLAFQIWRGAAQRLSGADLKGDCEVEAADIAVNDLADAAAAKSLLESAVAHVGKSRKGPAAARLQSVWGDYYAATGDGKSARKAYSDAQQALGPARSYAERTAWLGAHSRSTEEFLAKGQFDRAAAEIRAWQREFPSERLDGYLTLLYAKYWAAREQYPQAIAQADQLQAVNPESPYVDQILLLAAECESRRGRKDRALATLHGLVKNYPGSPLVPEVKKIIARLEER